MDAGPDWRVIQADEDAPQQPAVVASVADERVPRGLLAAIVAIIGVACGLAIWATLPAGGVAVESTSGAFDPRGVVVAVGTAHPSFALASTSPTVIVDIEGAVAQPGLHELPDGSRVGDAIAAAGGYAQNVDIDGASQSLNLAAKLTDGQQIHVPVLGEQVFRTMAPVAAGDSPGSGTTGGPIDINHATADELDTLPGIGPVTAAKIIDARTQQPFATVDELQSRGVVGQSTFDKLRDLITVTP